KYIKNINITLVKYRIHTASSVQSFKPKLLTSADCGVKMYQGLNSNLDVIIYKSFVDLRLKLTLDNFTVCEAVEWYNNYVYREVSSIFYRSKKTLYLYILKNKLISLAKKMVKR